MTWGDNVLAGERRGLAVARSYLLRQKKRLAANLRIEMMDESLGRRLVSSK